MKLTFLAARPMPNNEQRTHSNPGCVYFRVWNNGTVGIVGSGRPPVI